MGRWLDIKTGTHLRIRSDVLEFRSATSTEDYKAELILIDMVYRKICYKKWGKFCEVTDPRINTKDTNTSWFNKQGSASVITIIS